MTPAQVIKFYGSEILAAKRLSLTRQAINYWKSTGKIPVQMQALIQLRTKGKLKADIEALNK